MALLHPFCLTLIACLIVCCVCDGNSIDVNTSSGSVRGQTLHVLNRSIHQFLNIPYAEPPLGPLRFAPPEPLRAPKKDVIDGTVPGNSCIQAPMKNPELIHLAGKLTTSEDCLTLNVWTPMNTVDKESPVDQLKPIMFWIFGGAFSVGSIYRPIYNGSVLATHDVVIVTANYRLGQLGFLYGDREDAPGNVGFYDQLLALKWVRENAEQFGGDRDRITILGESAGSWSVSAHILSPLSKGLFKRAIMQSGSVLMRNERPFMGTVDALAKAKQTARNLQCNPYDYKWLDCLRAIENPELFLEPVSERAAFTVTFPIMGTQFLPITAQKAFKRQEFAQDIELLAGVTTDEGLPLAAGHFPEMRDNFGEQEFGKALAKLNAMTGNSLDVTQLSAHYLNGTETHGNYVRAFGQLYGDWMMTCPTYAFAKGLATSSGDHNSVHFYRFNYETGYTSGKFCGSTAGTRLFTETEYDFSIDVMKIWTDFAKHGKAHDVWPQMVDKSVIRVKDLNPNDMSLILDNPYEMCCVCDGNSIDVNTSSGSVRGQTLHVLNRSIHQFLNIPYAEPPLGPLRFALPEPLRAPKKDVIDGTVPGNSCIQVPMKDPELKHLAGKLTTSEDCLTLNVWTPMSSVDKESPVDQLKPIMFWIYGGAFSVGSIYQPIYNGSVLATHDVVIVTANYRLGQLGFLYGDREDAPGNVGFYDQLLALKWVRENAEQFGGDKDRITIFGESAGSWSVSAHILSPLSKGLFKRAIMQSGAVLMRNERPFMGTVDALAKAKQTARNLQCNPYDYKWLDCLRAVEDPELFLEPVPEGSDFTVTFPVMGTQFLPITAQKAFKRQEFAQDIELLAGVTTDEGLPLAADFPEMRDNFGKQEFDKVLAALNAMTGNSLDVTKLSAHYLNGTETHGNYVRAFGQLYGDYLMTCPTYAFAKGLATSGGDNNSVHFYRFNYETGYTSGKFCGSTVGTVCHGADVPLVFDKSSVIRVKDLNPNDMSLILDNPYESTCDGIWKHYF
ncbi:unnamed protein product [Medioppia subpectinata]|uniref:acetylcholinesterase n=1 Tax=Medioppia subpectinata TaxID=1979941 RepID=A0A7R9Q154_9ACAR|nr:unnamed protein product [Medioppia subpectinata]CAG2108862.1 unnamed protein product [Medioppia subpectinata]